MSSPADYEKTPVHTISGDHAPSLRVGLARWRTCPYISKMSGCQTCSQQARSKTLSSRAIGTRFRGSLCVCVYSPCSNTLPRLAALWAVNISKCRLRYCIVTPSFATSVNAYHLFRRAYRLLRSTFFFLAVRLGSAALKVLSVYNTCADTRVFEQFNNVRKTSIKTKTTRRTPSEPQNTAIF